MRSCGLDSRLPFLYESFIETAMGIPMSIILENGSAKAILRKIATRVVPQEATARKKIGFTEPLEKWFSDNLPGMLISLMDETKEADNRLLNFSAVHGIVKEHVEGRADHRWLSFYLISLLMWYRRWIEGRTDPPACVAGE
jgi:asparagine synthase (glutamine-hydrolysing)